MTILMNLATTQTVGRLVPLGVATIPGTEPRPDVRIINHFNSQEAATRYDLFSQSKVCKVNLWKGLYFGVWG